MGVDGGLAHNGLMVSFVDLPRVRDDVGALARELDARRWAIGEILERVHRSMFATVHIRQDFARQGFTWRSLARHVGLPAREITALRVTAAAFPPRERNRQLGWAHHHLVAARLSGEPMSVRRKWLRDAAKNGWSTYQLRQRLGARGISNDE